MLGYTVITAAILLAFGEGNLLAILLVLFVPGYVLVAALFPGSNVQRVPEIDWIERIALSLGLSIAVVPVLGLVLNFTPWGIRFIPIVVTMTLFTVVVGIVAYRRRMRLLPEQRLSATVHLAMGAWKEHGLLDNGLTIALAASIVVAGGTLAFVVLTPPAGKTFTEFYVLGPAGLASGYPTTLNASEAGSVILGIANHETATVNYTVRIDLLGEQLVYNDSSGFNETVEVNRTTSAMFNVTLADGRNWTYYYTFRINYSGLWKVEFLLFREGDFSSAYRELHLFVRVQ